MKPSIHSRRKFLQNGFTTAFGYYLIPSLNSTLTGLVNRFDSALFSFKVGNIKITIIRDEEFRSFSGEKSLEGPEVLDVSYVRWEMQMVNPSPFAAILVESGDLKILIDTGIGNSQNVVKLDGVPCRFSGKLLENLSHQNVDPDAINFVILTHFHPDHIGGIFNENGRLNFPNAEFIAHKNEIEYWDSAEGKKQPALFRYFIEKNIKPIKKDQLRKWNGTVEEILSGVRLVNTPGHTPGHLTVCIGEGREQFLCTSDSFFHPKHIENTAWRHHFDFDHSRSVKSRIMLLDWASHEKMLVQACHFDFPGLGHVEKVGHKWKWTELQVPKP